MSDTIPKPCPFCQAVPDKIDNEYTEYLVRHKTGCWLGDKYEPIVTYILGNVGVKRWNNRE